MNTATGIETEPGRRGARTRARARIAQRRRRQAARAEFARLTRAGLPLRSALLRVPFAIALIAILGSGISAVLYLNALTDESGMRTEQSNTTSSQLRLEIEALQRSIAQLDSTQSIARQAWALGQRPVGDATNLLVTASGQVSEVGQPAASGSARASR